MWKAVKRFYPYGAGIPSICRANLSNESLDVLPAHAATVADGTAGVITDSPIRMSHQAQEKMSL
jgi:hypothetical protein